jgi:hypothetical protein
MPTASRRSRQPVNDTPVKLQTPPLVLHQTEHVAAGIVQHPRTELWVSWLWEDPYFWYLMGCEQQEEAIECANACFAVFEQAGMRRTDETTSAINEIVWQTEHVLFPPPHEVRVAIMQMLDRPLTDLPACVWPKRDLLSPEAANRREVLEMRQVDQAGIPNRPARLLQHLALQRLHERLARLTPSAGQNMDTDWVAYH